jgi:hypothetical protein
LRNEMHSCLSWLYELIQNVHLCLARN